MPNALRCGEKLRLLEALGDELPAIGRAINLEQTLAAKWGRNAFVWSGRGFPGVLLLGYFTQIRVVWFNSSP